MPLTQPQLASINAVPVIEALVPFKPVPANLENIPTNEPLPNTAGPDRVPGAMAAVAIVGLGVVVLGVGVRRSLQRRL